MDDLPPPMPSAREIIRLEPLGDDRFRALRNQDNFTGVAFGGQLLGQALAAAQATSPEWPANSLNGYFLRAGRLDEPMDFAVTRCHDGRRFAVRRVTASQAGRNVFEMSCSFHQSESGELTNQFDTLGLQPDPQTLLPLKDFAAKYMERLSARTMSIFGKDFPIELRLTDPEGFFRSDQPLREFWFRLRDVGGPLSAGDQQALLAFMSDYWLPASIGAASSGGRKIRNILSLNHSLWFHAAANAGDWLFYRSSCPWAGQERGLFRGQMFDRTGQIVATATQEALLQAA